MVARTKLLPYLSDRAVGLNVEWMDLLDDGDLLGDTDRDFTYFWVV